MADDINISPDMINNMVNMLKNSGIASDNTENNNQSNNTNNLNDIISNLTSNLNANKEDNSNTDSNSNTLDIETILKIKSIMETLNSKNDPRSNLLYSLKPYLRKSKQSKLDQYANLLKITQVSGLFKNEKGESK